MCGITASYAYAPGASPVDPDELLAIRDAMSARGPDDAGLWLAPDGRAGLGHRRLAIIDLSPAGHQPMESADGRFRIVFNGEIYNYRALRLDLEQHGERFRSNSDTEVLLHLYQRHGPEMVHHLRGMYAFALWDAEREGLFLARDPFGIKPLYYADDGRAMRVASQVKALRRSPSVVGSMDPAGAVGFFLFGYVPEPHTFYRGIRALPAGTSLWVDRHGVRNPQIHFSLPEQLASAEASAASKGAAQLRAELRDALVGSIQHHLLADVRVGVFLSSGLDSGTITALAAEQGGNVLKTVTLGFEEYRNHERDEVPLAEAIARTYQTDHDTRWIRREDFEPELEPILAAMDQPSVDGVNTYLISKVAAETGLKVVLSGVGGDELFGTYASFRQIPQLVRVLGRLGGLARAGTVARRLSAPLVGYFTSPKYAGLIEYGTDFAGAYLLRRALYMPWELPRVLDPELARAGWEELQVRFRLGSDIAPLRHDFARVAALEFEWYMKNQLLRDADWAGMAHSLEIRVPLVDIDLFRAVAPMMMMTGPQRLTKHDMAMTPTIPLPAAVMARVKTGFNVPVREWLLNRTGSGSTPCGKRGVRAWSRLVFAAYARSM